MKANVTVLRSILQSTSDSVIEEIAGILAFNVNLSDEEEQDLFQALFNELIAIKEL